MTSLADRPFPSSRVSESQTVPLRATAVHEQGRVTVVVHGELDLGTAPALHREVQALLALPVEAIVIDLEGLDFVDSSGMRALNDLRQAAAERRIPFSVGPRSDAVEQVLELTGMTDLLGPATDA
jgi:anti-sigma B factor antagonist